MALRKIIVAFCIITLFNQSVATQGILFPVVRPMRAPGLGLAKLWRLNFGYFKEEITHIRGDGVTMFANI